MNTVSFIISLLILAIGFYVYAGIYDKCHHQDDVLTKKMRNSISNGFIRGAITGYAFGGASFSLLSGTALSLVNPIMIGIETIL